MSDRRRPHSRREKVNADNLKDQRRQPCARCGQRIDYTLPPNEPQAFIAGHIKSWRDYPHLRYDPANLQPEHASCGKSAGADDGRTSAGVTSRQW